MTELGRRVVAVAFVLVAVTLLLSPGGAGVYAAPVLLPVSWFMARRGGRAWRVVCSVLFGAVVGTVAWAGMYVLAEEPGPEILVLSVGVAMFTIALAFERAAPVDG